jgi:hypothetical protein
MALSWHCRAILTAIIVCPTYAISTATSISSVIRVPPPLGIKIDNSFQMFPCRWVIGSSHGGDVGEMLVKGKA